MATPLEAAMKVAAGAEELARTEHLIDLARPDVDRRMSLDESIRLAQERYGEAIRLLGKL